MPPASASTLVNLPSLFVSDAAKRELIMRLIVAVDWARAGVAKNRTLAKKGESSSHIVHFRSPFRCSLKGRVDVLRCFVLKR